MEKITQISTEDELPGVDDISHIPATNESVEVLENINTKNEDAEDGIPMDSEVLDEKNEKQIERKREINKIRQELGMGPIPDDEPIRSSHFHYRKEDKYGITDGVFNFGEWSRLSKEEERIRLEQQEIEERARREQEEIEERIRLENEERVRLEKQDEEMKRMEAEAQEWADAAEKWRLTGMEEFGIKDFNLEDFKRSKFIEPALIEKTLAEGKDWDYIDANPDIFKKEISYNEILNAHKVMRELEEEIPGSVKYLHETLGITNFQRYPKELLIDQLKEPDPNKALALLAFAKEDHNGAFDQQKPIWQSVYEEQGGKYNFRVCESGSGFSLARQFLRARNDFGKEISEIFLNAHGNEEGFDLGEEFVGVASMQDFTERFDGVIADNAEIIANSCSAGVAEGWLHKLTKSTHIRAIGPDEPSYIVDMDYLDGEIIPKYEKNSHFTNYVGGFQISKK